MDTTIAFNKERWEELSSSGVTFSIPWLDLKEETAHQLIDPESQLDQIQGKKVLCLAASGGQQSVAFGILGAQVTVFDLSEKQLEKDRVAAEHYGINVDTIQGDMQNLCKLPTDYFEIVWLAHSINFVPNVSCVIKQVARLCKTGAKLRMSFTNPYVHGVWDCPMGEGFLLSQPYVDGAQVTYADPYWEFTDPHGKNQRVQGPKEYRHSLSTIINSLISNGLIIKGFWETVGTELNPASGSWEHFMRVAPPWLTIWAQKG
jgi:2-polyprenyl-3-methyl-5-hydroxy-6-metoxy-1,4-benzoquinol methylase